MDSYDDRAIQCAGRVFLCLGHGFPASGGGVHGASADELFCFNIFLFTCMGPFTFKSGSQD